MLLRRTSIHSVLYDWYKTNLPVSPLHSFTLIDVLGVAERIFHLLNRIYGTCVKNSHNVLCSYIGMFWYISAVSGIWVSGNTYVFNLVVRMLERLNKLYKDDLNLPSTLLEPPALQPKPHAFRAFVRSFVVWLISEPVIKVNFNCIALSRFFPAFPLAAAAAATTWCLSVCQSATGWLTVVAPCIRASERPE